MAKRGRPRKGIATRETSPEEIERMADEIISQRHGRRGRRGPRAVPQSSLISELLKREAQA